MERKSNVAIKPEAPEGHSVIERIARIESCVTHLRSDVDRLITIVGELRAELRTEFRAGLQELRAEFRAEHQQLAKQIQELNARYEELKREILRSTLSTRIWMLLLTGTVLAVMAHGFKWL